MAVRFRETADGLAAEQIVGEDAFVHDVHRPGPDAFRVHFIGADETFALEVLHGGVVYDVDECGKNTRPVTGGKSAGGAVRCPEIWFSAENVGTDELGHNVVGGIGRE